MADSWGKLIGRSRKYCEEREAALFPAKEDELHDEHGARPWTAPAMGSPTHGSPGPGTDSLKWPSVDTMGSRQSSFPAMRSLGSGDVGGGNTTLSLMQRPRTATSLQTSFRVDPRMSLQRQNSMMKLQQEESDQISVAMSVSVSPFLKLHAAKRPVPDFCLRYAEAGTPPHRLAAAKRLKDSMERPSWAAPPSVERKRLEQKRKWRRNLREKQAKIDGAQKRQGELIKEKAQLIKSDLDHRHTRYKRAQELRLRIELQRKWLWLVALVPTTQDWGERYNQRKKICAQVTENINAVRVLQRYMRRKYRMLHAERKLITERALKKVVWRLLLWLRCTRRKLAQRLVKRFFGDFGASQQLSILSFMVSKFRWNVVNLQRIMRASLRVMACRRRILCFRWSELEAKVLLAIEAEKKAQHERDRTRMRRGLGISMNDSTILPTGGKSKLPTLNRQINRATAQSRALQYTINHAFVKLTYLEDREQERAQLRRRHNQLAMSKSNRDMLEATLTSDFLPCNLISEQEKMMHINTYLGSRQRAHVKTVERQHRMKSFGNKVMDETDVKYVLNNTFVGQPPPLPGSRCSTRVAWPPLLLLTGPGSENFAALVESVVRRAVAFHEGGATRSASARLGEPREVGGGRF